MTVPGSFRIKSGMRGAVLFLAMVVCAGGAAVGGPMVVFDDGRALAVRSVEIRDGQAYLELAEGGNLVVPAARIAGQEVRPDAAPPEDLAAAAGVLAEALRPEARWREVAGSYADRIAAAAARNRVDPELLTAIVKVESNFDPFAVSSRGACGLAQLMPGTARRFGTRDVFDAEQNLEGGARYLRWLLDRFQGKTDLALAGYNAGEAAVDRHGGIPPYRETLDYVVRVLGRAEDLVAAP